MGWAWPGARLAPAEGDGQVELHLEAHSGCGLLLALDTVLSEPTRSNKSLSPLDNAGIITLYYE